MNLAPRNTAARNALGALLIVQAMIAPIALAEGEAQLILPLMSAMAFGVAAAQATRPREAGAPPLTVSPPPRPGAISLLPQRISIPDGYAVDVDTDPPRFVDPVNRDRIVALDLFGQPRRGWTACAAYDEEKRGPFKGTADVLRLVLEFRF
ncbi:MAG: hypothetical protein E6J79_16750 [Deltaproteobacteria bacterium]|nr:MAG: hypothetical protein E6J79_16750 [Deltaproteobacteria bacterium]